MLFRTIFQRTFVQEIYVDAFNQDERTHISARNMDLSVWVTSWSEKQIRKKKEQYKRKNPLLIDRHAVFLPDAFDQHVHAFIHKVPVGLTQTEALLFKHLGETQQVRRAHFKVSGIQKDDLQEQRLFPQTLAEPQRHLPLGLGRTQTNTFTF